ncbi:hypothetical protein [Mucilaginibacter arboris]|uniref:Uncharacterized protein n=1 Tax=Mucilaginibacter arboris TaxID=2682090 RepID=A0A7K1T0V5_9SPHI|nr:hypothetical protein [Mucilaginibacter arboris]MVN23167.1 hypothetical protein [Mucilaginibacter arboris]
MKYFSFFILNFIVFTIFSCKQKVNEKHSPAAEESNEQRIARTKTSFKTISGIRFTEVYRRFDNGVSFNAQGYQLKPSWKLYFVSDTVVNLYSDIKKRYYELPVTLDHDSIFNMGGAWFKARKINKDSLFFQVLSVKNKVISWKNSNVYVTFYAEDYLKNILHKKAKTLQGTTKKDTAYIRALAIASSHNPKKIFAAQQPVTLKSKSTNVAVTNAKVKAKDLDSYYIPETLFYPEYSITIHQAYADFYHTFAVQVDAKGQMHFVEPMEEMFPDEKENIIKVMKGIMDGYLKLYLDITPGKTLGIAHDSLILLVVRGYTS